MTNEFLALERYLKEVLGIQIAVAPWRESGRLPAFLRDQYLFFQTTIDGQPCLLMKDRAKAELSPATVRKHMALVLEKWNADIIYVRDRVTSYNRKRLIEQKIPFIVPGNQMYLPMLGIDLREHFRKLRLPTPTLTPATQALIVHVLLMRHTVQRLTPTQAATELSYTPMTMTRVFDEIESASLLAMVVDGRQRCLLVPGDLKELWEKALPFLRSPIRKRIYVSLMTNEPPGPFAGLSALARYSDLAEPNRPIFAVSRERWKTLKQKRQVRELPIAEADATEIEVWNYSPHRSSVSQIVDRFSLYLSLKDNPDERVEAALDQMMRGVQW
ncbi:MAG: hypothetical protein GX444_11950 [Myxococcales bacterium]|nr:hypothetical protein [Myxococcales bacterium]